MLDIKNRFKIEFFQFFIERTKTYLIGLLNHLLQNTSHCHPSQLSNFFSLGLCRRRT